jgi:PST family polysaccharide transporter
LQQFKKILQQIKNNKKVGENYFFMTVLQILNSLFYLAVYPFLIRKLGAESYGLYIFALSVVNYFTVFIIFGFDFPAVKIISQNQNDVAVKSDTVSKVLTAKLYLLVAAISVFVVLLFCITAMREHWVLYMICFGQVLTNILLPTWYFQGVQKMRTVTLIQFMFRLLSLPFIFWLIKTPADNWIFALIVTITFMLGGVEAMFVLKFKEKLRIRIVAFHQLKPLFKDSLPFFWSSSAGIIKLQSVAVIIGSFFSMADVALYDLANRIIMLPQTLTASINGALFPKIINSLNNTLIKKILRYEVMIGLLSIVMVAIFGRWAVLLLGGSTMLAAYPLAVILSITIFAYLVVGCYISFIFVPQNKYYYVTRNQIVAFVSFFVLCMIGILIIKNIVVVVLAFSLSGISEVIYCHLIVKRKQLFYNDK